MHPLHNLALFAGRLLISALFIFDAYLMLTTWDSSAAYMASFGLPPQLLPVVAFCQAAGGLMILFGFWTRLAALAFAAYCVATAVVFHRNLGSNAEIIQAGKDLAIAGGFLCLAAAGPGAWALDRLPPRNEI